MDEPPPPGQSPSDFSIGELKSDRDINLANQQFIYYFAAEVGDVAAEAKAASRTSSFFAELGALPLTDHSFARTRLAELSALLASHHLLLIHPQADVPALQLARSIASIAQSAYPATRPAILEFTGLPNDDRRFDLIEEVDRFTEPSLFLVLEANREVLGWNLRRLSETLLQHGHLLIAIAAVTASTWRFEPSELEFWHEASTTGLFDSAAIEALLCESLDAAPERLPAMLCEEWLGHRTLGGHLAGPITQRLGTPLNVRSFVQGLRNLPLGADAAAVDGLIGQILQQQQAGSLRRWFFQQLSRRDQLIALGASLFTGLREDLFYLQVQRLLVEAWGLREFEGRLLDYVDLEPAEAFFSFNEVEPGRVQVESRYGDLRTNLLALALTDYQRHVRQAVTWMADLLRQSMQRGVGQQEGFEQYPQRAEVRRVIGEALSDIGLLRLSLVEHPLLALIGAQRVELPLHAARVFARWYELGETRAFEQLLHRWSTSREPVEAVRAWLERNRDPERTDPTDALHACILLICGYAARVDPPDAIVPLLFEQMAALACAPGPLVRRAWRSAALANLIPVHVNQLTPLLTQLVVHDDLRGVVAEQLALAHEHSRQRDVYRLIMFWLKEAEKQYNDEVLLAPEQTEATLLTITRFLERLPYRGEMDQVAGRRVQGLLQYIERLPAPESVHQAVRTARCRIGRHDPALLNDMLRTLSPEEVPVIAEVLLQVYLDERAAQPDGDLTLKHGGRPIPIRLDGKRPLTTTEKKAKEWLLSQGSPAQRRLALHMGIAQVRVLDRREQAFIAEQLALADGGDDAGATVAADATPAHAKSSFFYDQVVPTLVTLDAPYLRSAIIDLLPEARRLRAPTRDDLTFLLQAKWPLQGKALDELARRLGEALALCERGWGGLRLVQYPAAFYTIVLLVLIGRAPLLLVGGLVMLIVLALVTLVVVLR